MTSMRLSEMSPADARNDRLAMDAFKKAEQQQINQRQFHQQMLVSDFCGEMGRPGIGHNGGPPLRTWADAPRDTRPARGVVGF